MLAAADDRVYLAKNPMLNNVPTGLRNEGLCLRLDHWKNWW